MARFQVFSWHNIPGPVGLCVPTFINNTILLVEQLEGTTLSSERSLMLCFFSHVDTSATPTVLSTSWCLWFAPINAQVHTRRPVLSGTVEVNNGGQWKGRRKGKSKLHQQSGFPHNYYTKNVRQQSWQCGQNICMLPE